MGNVLISEGAEADYVESLLWYAERSPQAVEGFEVEFARAVKAIADDPDRFPVCDDHHRFYLFKRYPFQLIYCRAKEGDLLIVAVAHTSRSTKYWSKR